MTCMCMGPLPGHVLCPCMERAEDARRGSSYLPAPPTFLPPQQHGCICPPRSEETCQGPLCPRRPTQMAGSSMSTEVKQ